MEKECRFESIFANICVGAIQAIPANWNSKRVTNNKSRRMKKRLSSQFSSRLFLITLFLPLISYFCCFCCLRLRSLTLFKKVFLKILHEQLRERKVHGVINLIATDVYGENRF